jgi:hypothetical protein
MVRHYDVRIFPRHCPLSWVEIMYTTFRLHLSLQIKDKEGAGVHALSGLLDKASPCCWLDGRGTSSTSLSFTRRLVQNQPVQEHRLIMIWGDDVSELRPPTALLFTPHVIGERGEPWWWLYRLGITPDSFTRALWQSYQQRYLGQGGGKNEGVRILPISIWNTSRDL